MLTKMAMLSPVVTHHVLKQLLGHKVVLSSCLLAWSDWTSGVWRNRATANQNRAIIHRWLSEGSDMVDHILFQTNVLNQWRRHTRYGSLEDGRVQFDESLPQFIHADTWSTWTDTKQAMRLCQTARQRGDTETEQGHNHWSFTGDSVFHICKLRDNQPNTQ